MRSLRAVAVVAAGFAVGVMPALGASKSVTNNGNTWSPSAVEVAVGDDVKWTWTGTHNVAFDDGNRSGDVTILGSGTHERRFETAGTYRYVCEAHEGQGMVGTVTVKQASTTTTTTTTTTPETTTTQTTTTETAPTNTAPADTTAPTISRLARRASRRALIVTFRSSEDGDASAIVRRREPRGRQFRVIVRRTRGMSVGSNVWTLQRTARGLRRGAYRVTLVFTDEAGNAPPPRTLVFKIA